jgi:hypothetical protein
MSLDPSLSPLVINGELGSLEIFDEFVVHFTFFITQQGMAFLPRHCEVDTVQRTAW